MNDADIITDSLPRPESFAILFDRYAGSLYRHVSRRLGPVVAEDIVGETFLAAFRKRAKFDTRYQDARPWLFGIATKLVARHHRDEITRYRAWGRSAQDPGYETSAEDAVARSVTAGSARGALAKALAGLSASDRDVLLLVAWADFSYEEVAQALGIPVGTVRSRLHRARRKTRAAIGANPMHEEYTHG
ncbi:RNA polymerase sigma factor [Actinocorallia sp. API 0066]|uniref:RNA polymerase sigma factor n=1 Tax=Actinocorallia sp. API 0066 TaxID=2896846 RepID=UPI001E3B344D|nr:RNA polymerase sigma factor [Actinocorallia sp. API 0066]MCD0453020.1 RNA polymerase sigma factor [Actinocorallia sp. API 0066]